MSSSMQHGSVLSSPSCGAHPVVSDPLVFPPNGETILLQSLEAQLTDGMAFSIRSTDNEEELRQKKVRHQILRLQLERRHELDLVDRRASEITRELLQQLAVAIRERQKMFLPEGYQSIAFENGDIYEGNWKSCLMHGTGFMRRVASNDVYEGDWFFGLRSGIGTRHSPNFRTLYSGRWQDDKWHGRGELLEPEGVFSGEFVDGRIQGYGEYVYNDGHVYKGEWRNGLYDGAGTYLFPSGAKYEGQWSDGLEHGRGTMTYFNGDTYTGEWKYGLKHGVGTYTSELLQYEGCWFYGAIHGRGQCKYTDGSTYEGDWQKGLYHGEGKFVNQKRKQSYVGEFHHGKRSGRGSYCSEEVEYNGEWLDDKKHGLGEIRTRGGGTFRGTWHHDLPHGEGIYASDGGEVYVTYEFGRCVHASPHGPYQQVNLRLVSAEDKSVGM